MIQIQGYKIVREIGEGGMARVYLAVQESLEREVAIKLLAGSLVSDQDFCTRFLHEGKTLAKLNHPNVVSIYDSGVREGNYYLAMELIRGGTLEERLKQHDLKAAEIVQVMRQVALALECAHRQDLIHRDIKPANVLFREDGTAVLSDFGIAKPLNAKTSVTQAGMIIGTPSYMSPEQVSGKQVTPASDLYSLGVMFYEMLTGELPYNSDDQLAVAVAHIQAPVPTLTTQTEFQPIIDRLMAKAPEDRFPDARSLIEELGSETPQTVVRPPKTEVISALDTASGRKKALLAGGLLAALVAIGVATYLWWPQQATQDVADVVPARGPSQSLDGQTQARIEELLALAQSHFEIGRLTEPMGGNAYEVAEQVLSIDPVNMRARELLTEIARTYESLAQESIDQGARDEAKIYMAQGLKVWPDHPGLKALQQQLAAESTQ